MADKKVVRHPFRGLEAGKQYLYENEAAHFTSEPRYDDKSKLLPSKRSAAVPCTIIEFPERVQGGRVIKKLVVNFANTPNDVLHDLKNIPETATFTEVQEEAPKK
jgi:hypothetical protein